MRSHPGIALLGTTLALLGAGLISQASRAATPAPGEQNSTRIAQIMQRLRNVQRFDAVSVAANGKTIAWTVTEKKPAAAGGKAGHTAGGGKPGQLLQVANVDGAQVRTVTIPQAAKSCRYSNLRWSPDSRTLAFLSNCNHDAKSDDQFDIYEVAAGGTRGRRISHLHGLVNQLYWTPNGSELSFLYVMGDVHPVSAVSATKAPVGVIGETGVERQGIAMLPASGGKRVKSPRRRYSSTNTTGRRREIGSPT